MPPINQPHASSSRKKYNQIQVGELAKLPDEQRQGKAFLYRIGNAAYCYQFQFNDIADSGPNTEMGVVTEDLIEWPDRQQTTKGGNPTAQELLQTYFGEFLAGLPNQRVRDRMERGGVEEAKGNWSFRRYVLERNNFGMEEFMRLNLSQEDYTNWCEPNGL